MTLKFDRFVVALKILCREHGVTIASEGCDRLLVCDEDAYDVAQNANANRGVEAVSWVDDIQDSTEEDTSEDK